jgi:hypothetical protein
LPCPSLAADAVAVAVQAERVGPSRGLAALGFDHVIFAVAGDHQIGPVETIARQVLLALADL